MKKSLVLFLILMISGYSIFSATTADEKISLKGNIYTTNKQHPEFKSGNNVYQLMLPRYLVANIKDGDTVEIEGFKLSKEFINSMMPNGSSDLSKDTEYVFVSKITYNGKTIEVQKEKGNFASGHGKRGQGMMGFGHNCPMW